MSYYKSPIVRRPLADLTDPAPVSKFVFAGMIGLSFVGGMFVGGLVTHMYHDKTGNLRWNGRRRRSTRRGSRR